ncbi:MAG: site-specific integrase [Eubacterium sp.]|nr:site-specific integrase [Eubacterium sp.]
MNELLKFYIDHGIISLDIVFSLEQGEIMNRILKKVHPYKIHFMESSQLYATYISDETRPEGRKRITRKTKSALERFLLDHYKSQMALPVTFESIYQEFMEYKSRVRAETTVNAYVKTWKKYYKDDPIIKKDLRELTTPELEIWLADHIKAEQMNYKKFSKFSVLFRQLCEYARKRKYISQNPFDFIDYAELGIFKTRKKKSTQKTFSKVESKDINEIAFEDFRKKPHAVPLAVLFVFQTGIRLGEAAALKWSDIDGRILHIQRIERRYQDADSDFKSLGKYHYTIVDDTKGEFGPRDIVLSDDALYILEILRDYYQDQGIVSEWLFFTRKTGKIHDRALDIRIRKYCREAGILERSMHKIRSTFISSLRDAGMSFEKIAEIVGHKDVRTTIGNYSFDVNTDEENLRFINSLDFLPKIS